MKNIINLENSRRININISELEAIAIIAIIQLNNRETIKYGEVNLTKIAIEAAHQVQNIFKDRQGEDSKKYSEIYEFFKKGWEIAKKV